MTAIAFVEEHIVELMIQYILSCAVMRAVVEVIPLLDL